jgi:hypothetical protein
MFLPSGWQDSDGTDWHSSLKKHTVREYYKEIATVLTMVFHEFKKILKDTWRKKF